ncbi:Cleavage stimulation factor subunit 2 [Perkinsus chesapeaki]|uniref:Cleavage stimulation factor subunit 2 n=1 Tax=Perkinsus chesapeaki TaxID=330153 RepID=A0A7J6LH49_PERCH|nr:Cleavage stimulation factor subunit 2 [Perkinsus chesapeaki]
MFRQQNRSCSVFVGNVPYDVDEEQLKTIFSTVGPVVSFRLMHDKVTGRPKGYGFCEYADQETAYAAMRNLNNVECGGRPLRVDWADHELRNTEGVQRSIQRSGADVGRGNVKVNNKKLREFQQRLTDENAEHLALDVADYEDEIAALLNQWSTVELYEFLGHSQQFVNENPEGARALFVAHPQLPLAINHVAYLLGFTSEPTFPMTPDDIIYAEERIKALRQHRICPAKPIQPPRAVPISLVTDPTAQLQAGISNPMMSGVLPTGVLAAGASIAGARATTVGTISRVTSIGTGGVAAHAAAAKKPVVDIAALPADTKEALRKQLAQMTPAEVASLPADVREIMQQLAVSTGGGGSSGSGGGAR